MPLSIERNRNAINLALRTNQMLKSSMRTFHMVLFTFNGISTTESGQVYIIKRDENTSQTRDYY